MLPLLYRCIAISIHHDYRRHRCTCRLELVRLDQLSSKLIAISMRTMYRRSKVLDDTTAVDKRKWQYENLCSAAANQKTSKILKEV